MFNFFKNKDKSKEQTQSRKRDRSGSRFKPAPATSGAPAGDAGAGLNLLLPQTAPATSQEIPHEPSWAERLKSGLKKSSSSLGGNIKGIFTTRKLDEETLEELEDTLIMADMGVKTVSHIISTIRTKRFGKDLSPRDIQIIVAGEISQMLAPFTRPLTVNPAYRPHIMLFCGVNGTGKTTTIGKMAKHFTDEGKRVTIAACDTFRAAAVEQLESWASRTHCTFVKGKPHADPASVAFQAIEQAKAEHADVVLIDTAGRLQNKAHLMEQLAKIIRVIKKCDATAPHDTIIVLDATTGQNAHSQVQAFKTMVDVSGMVITKLDGTARGGVVVGLAQAFSLPIHAIGVGEKIQDLQHFDAKEFAEVLVGM